MTVIDAMSFVRDDTYTDDNKSSFTDKLKKLKFSAKVKVNNAKYAVETAFYNFVRSHPRITELVALFFATLFWLLFFAAVYIVALFIIVGFLILVGL